MPKQRLLCDRSRATFSESRELAASIDSERREPPTAASVVHEGHWVSIYTKIGYFENAVESLAGKNQPGIVEMPAALTRIG